MGFPPHIWQQLKSLSKSAFCSALERDGWTLDMNGGSARIYRKPGPPPRRVSIHFHCGSDTFGKSLLQGLLHDTCWDIDDLRRLKLVK